MRPQVVPGPSWRFPKPDIWALPNGLTIWAFHLPGQYVISAHLLIQTGLDAEPPAIEGVATLALQIVDEGTRSHPNGEITELIDAQGVGIGGRQHHYTSQLSLTAPVTRLAAALPLFAELVLEPDSAERDVDHYRDQLQASYRQWLASPRGTSTLALPRAIYEASDRRTRPASGTPATLAAITRDDVLAWQGQWGPTGSVLVIAGDLPADLMTLIEDAFGDWQPQPTVAHTRPALAERPRALVVDRPNAVQADVLFGRYSIGRTDPRLPAATLAGHVMGGGFTNRLNLRLREELGYCYGIGGGFSPGRYGGSFNVSSSFRLEIAAAAIAETLAVLELGEDFTESELSATKRFVIGVRPLAFQTAADVAAQAALLADGLSNVEYVHAFDDALAAVTASEASAVYRELMDVSQLSLAISGPAELLVPELAEIGIAAEVIDL